MKKIRFLLFNIGLVMVLFGCQKSQDAEFEMEVDRIERGYGIEFLLKKERTDFGVFESLEGVEVKNHVLLEKSLLFENEYLSRENKNLKEALETFARHKYNIWREGNHEAIDSTKVFSIIQILKSKTENSELSNEEQFYEMINILEAFPSYFFQAKKIIKNPSKEKLENAIRQYSQDYFYLKNELSLLIRKPDILKEDQIDFSQKNEKAQLVVKDFIAYLNSHLFELEE